MLGVTMSFHSTHIPARTFSLQWLSLQWITRLMLPFVVLALVLSTTGCSVVMGILGPSEADITGVEPEPTRLLVPTPIGQQAASAAERTLRNGPTPTPFVMRTPTQRPPTVSYTGSNGTTSIAQQGKMQVTISGDTVNLRNAPGLDTRVLASMPRGTAFAYVDEDATGEWIQVCCVESQLAWIYADLVTVARGSGVENTSTVATQSTVNTSIVAQTTENSAIPSVGTRGSTGNSNAGTGVQRLAQTLTTENRALSLDQVLSSGPTRFTSDEAAFTITLPAGWLPLADSSKVIQSSIDAIEGKNPEMAALLTEQLSLIEEIPIALIAFDLSPETLNSGFATNVNIMRQPVPAGFSLSYLVQFSADQLETVLGLSDAAEQTQVVLPAGETVILDYQLNNQAIARQYYLLHDQNLYIATFSASASLAASSTILFNEIMQSFNFN